MLKTATLIGFVLLGLPLQARGNPFDLKPEFGEVRLDVKSVPPPLAQYVANFGHPSSAPLFVLRTAERRLVAFRVKVEGSDGVLRVRVEHAIGHRGGYAHHVGFERGGGRWFGFDLRSVGEYGRPEADSGWQTLDLIAGSYEVGLGHPTPADHPGVTATLTVVDLEARPRPLLRAELDAGPLLLDGLRGAPLGLHENWPTTRAQFGDAPSNPGIEIPAALGCRRSWHSDVPIAVFDVKEPLGRTRLQLVRGRGLGLLVRFASGDQHCSPKADYSSSLPAATLTLADVPPGRVEVYALPGFWEGSSTWVGTADHPKGSLYYTLEVESLERPRFDRHVPEMKVNLPLVEPRAFEVVPSSLVERCGGQSASGDAVGSLMSGRTPLVVLELDRPVDSLVLRPVGVEEGAIVLEGPLGPDGRVLSDGHRYGGARVEWIPVSEKCLPLAANDPIKVPRLEPGRYALYLAGESQPASATLLVQGSDTQEAPDRMWRTPAEGSLPIEARAITRYFGSYTVGARYPLDVQQAVFLSAPLGIFVWTTFDTDRTSAELAMPLTRSSAGSDRTIEYPRKNEPMLLLETRVSHDKRRLATLMSADGNVWTLDQRYLALERSGPAVVPGALRNLLVAWSDIDGDQGRTSVAAGKELDEIDKLFEKGAKIDECIDKRLSAQRPEYVVIRSNSTQRVHSDAVIQAADRACGLAAWEKSRDAMTKRVEARLKADGAAALARIAARFAL